MEKIKELRLNKGWSQEELAKKSGVGRISIIRYENNERIPQVDVASRIANALGCTIDELLGEKKEETPCR
jgi:transcriptional regulator with XRE-family HTH domain